jgi:hypothetical protein
MSYRPGTGSIALLLVFCASIAPAQTATNTTLASSPNPSVYGQFITLTATVTPSTATGTVTFMDGSTNIGTGTLNNGSATLDFFSRYIPTVGTHVLTAVYGGDTNDAGSTSAVVTQTVTIATPTVSLSSSLNPSAAGQSVTLIASILPSGATGTVTFMDGSTILGTANLNFATATLGVPNLSAGTHSLTASYSGDANDSAGTSATLSQVVDQPANATTTSLGSSLNPSNLSQSVTLTATVSPSAATGKVTFYDGVAVLGTVAPSGGQASITTKLLPSGVQSLKAYFGLGPTYGASYSTVLPQAIRALPSSGFAAASSTGAGLFGYSVAVADFNGDGKPDFAAPSLNGVSVVLGKGDGTFQTPVSYPAGSDTEFVAAGDFNGDGKTDLVVSNFNPNGTVSVLLGNGDGTFQAPMSYAAGALPFQIAVADFNGDGKADLAVTSNYFGPVSVLLGNGDGTFQQAANYASSGAFWGVVAGDFNGDGKADLAVNNSNGLGISVLIGNGDGTFQAPVDYSVGGDPLGLAVGDFNGDGKTDLATADYESGDVSVLLGKGDGTFQTAVDYAVGTNPWSVIVGDFNGDGATDLAAANNSGGNVSVLLGNGDGTFQTAVNYGVGSNAPAIAAGDFNLDGRTDLVVSSGDILLGIPAATTATTTALTSSLNPSVYGQVVFLTAKVTPSTATGTVTFKDGTTTLCTNAVGSFPSVGTATCLATTLSVGAHSITATYNGDANDSASTSSVLTQTVTIATPTVGIISSANPSATGQNITLIASVLPQIATGMVTFKDGPATLGTGTLNGGVATLAISTLAAGSHSLTVTYAGDANDNPGTSSILTQVVDQPANTTTLSLGSSVNPSSLSQNVTLTATVTPSSATGNVTFYDGTTVLETKPVTGGQAAATTDLLPFGKQSLKAYFSLNANYGASTSAAVTQTVDALPANGFQASVFYPTSAGPFSVAVADFNGDGKPDMAVGDQTANGINVFIGNGDGTFQPAAYYATGSFANGIATGDFNGDGKTDLAVTNDASDGVSVLLGNGDGTFQAPVNYGTGFSSGSIAVGDFNGDGKADLVTILNMLGEGGISVLLGNGDGTFQAAATYPTGGNSVVVGDFNGDGKADLAISNLFEVSVLLGNGDGTFQTPASYSVGSFAQSVAVGDFNGDGKPDLVTSNSGSNNVSVLLGNGDGTFQAAVNYGAGTNPTGIAVADVNGDGKPDLVASNSGSNNVSVLLGNGDGTFQAAVNYGAGTYPAGVAVGDFNRDGRTDIAVANNNSSNVSILLGIPTIGPSTTTLTSSLNPSVYGQSVTLTATVSPSIATGTVTFKDGNTILCSSGVGSFSSAGTATCGITTLQAGAHSITATYNGDANDTPSTSSVLTQNVTIATPAVSIISSANPSVVGQNVTLIATLSPIIATGTVTFKDGPTILGTQTTGSDGVTTLSVSTLTAGSHLLTAVYGGDANDNPAASPVLSQVVDQPTTVTTTNLSSSVNPSLFGQSTTLTASVSPSTASGNVTFYDGTTVLDTRPLVGGQATVTTKLLPFGANSLKAYFAFGATYEASTSTTLPQIVGSTPVPSSGFQPAVYYPTTAGAVTVSDPEYVVTADFNGDNIADLAVANYETENVSILLGNGDGTFGAAVNYPIGSNLFGLAVGDFNGDGKADLVTGNGNFTVSILLGNGDGTFKPAVPYSGGGDYVAIGDFNGDGKTDLATISSSSGEGLSVLLGNGDGTFQPAENYGTGSNAFGLAVGDFNNDGLADLVFTNQGSNSFSVLLGNGDGTFRGALEYTVGSEPREIAVGDFNGDGKADVAIANNGSNTLSVLLGNGDGTFQPQVAYPVTTGFLWHVVPGDVNGDGKLDLVAGGGFPGSEGDVAVLLGNGDGTFQAAVNYPVNGFASIALGDYNRDGAMDIAATSGGVSVLLGIPSTATTTTVLTSSLNPSVYGQPVTLTATVTPSTATGSVTFKDGNTILCARTIGFLSSAGTATCNVTTLAVGAHSITATYDGDANDFPSTSSVLMQNVTIATPVVSVISSANPSAVGQVVTLVAAVSPFIATGTVTFFDGESLLGTGTLNLGAATLAISTLSAGSHSLSATYGGDANDNPGTSPVVTQVVDQPANTTTLSLGSSVNPSFLSQSVMLTATVTPPAATGNVTFYDGTTVLDTKPVIGGQATLSTNLLPSGNQSLKAYFGLSANYGASISSALTQAVNALPANGFQPAVFYPSSTDPLSVAVGDFNGDGKPDLAVANFEGNNVSVFIGNGDGTFQPAVYYATGRFAFTVATGDFNGDGKTDLAVTNYEGNNVSILLGNGDGTFQAAMNSPAGNGPVWFAVGDFNGDGKADLAVAYFGGNTVGVLLGNGDGTFQAPVNYNAGSSPYSVTVGDFNRDGKADLVTGNLGGENVTVLLGNGDGTFRAPVSYPAASPGNQTVTVTVGDLNSDGKPDLAVANSSNISVLLGNGDGTFQAAMNYDAGGAPFSIVVGDFNGDGKLDLAASDSIGNSVSVLLGNGDGTFQTATSYSTGSQPFQVAVGDFNGDGRTDLAVATSSGNSVGILVGIPATATTTTTLTSSLNPSSFGQSVTFTATVSPSLATGTVTFFDGVNQLGTGFLSNGAASLMVSTLTAASHSIKAVYGADADDAGSTSNMVTQFVAVVTPTISGLNPSWATAGGPGFTLTVNGSNFLSGATVEWGATALATNFVSATQLTASVSTSQIASPGSVQITVANPGGGISGPIAFPILAPSGQTWTQLAPTGGPPTPRAAQAAVFDPVTAQMIVFGGSSGDGDLSDVWSLSTGASPQWTNITPDGPAPHVRTGASAVYDSTNSRMTIFGGGLGSSSPCANDVWVLSNANSVGGSPAWTQLSPTGPAPAPRIFHQSVYDPGSNSMIVFGGNSCVGGSPADFFNDVWVLSNANGLSDTPPAWTQLSLSDALPPSRENFSAVYDATSNTMMVFAGANNSGLLNDVWILTDANGVGGSSSWMQLSPTGTPPALRTGHTAVYDSVSKSMTVFGGNDGSLLFNDTWVLSNANGSGSTTAWTQLAPLGALPPARDEHTAVYDPTTNRMIIFGGTDGPLNDVWALGDANAVISISSLMPNSATAGGSGFLLTVNGSGFVNGSVVQWNGTPLTPVPPTSATQVTAMVSASLIASQGSASVTVVNPSGATSASATFTINPQPQPPPPPPQSQTITFAPLSGVTLPASPIALIATASSGLPVTFTSTTPSICTVSGSTVTPLAVGTCSVVASQSGSAGFFAALSVTQSFPISTQLTVPGGALTPGSATVPYSANLTASGGISPDTWSLTGGALPDGGVSLSADGSISGTPKTPGTYTFSALATDSKGATALGTFSIVIAPAPLVLTSVSFPTGYVGSPYPLQILSATGGVGPYTFTISNGTLPAGLTLSSPQFSGTPTAVGIANFTVTVNDTRGARASAAVSITVHPKSLNLIVSQSTVSFSLTVGSNGVPPPAGVPVQSSDVTQVVNYSVTSSVSWLDVTGGGTTPGSVGIVLDTSALSLGAAGSPYQTTINVTCLAPSACGGSVQTIAVSLTVTAAAPQLAVTSGLISFSTLASNPAPVSQSLGIQNTGGGMLDITSVTAADNWLTITDVPSTVAPGPGAQIAVTASPAALSGEFNYSTITVVSSAGTAIVPVTLTITQNPYMTLGPGGATIQTVAGNPPGDLTGSFSVSVTGAGSINWSASVQPGAAWLSVSTLAGSAAAASPGTVNFAIDPTISANLPAQVYTGSIQVTSGDVADSPLVFQVYLNVNPASTTPTPQPGSSGLVYTSGTGGSTPSAVRASAATTASVSSQTIPIYASSATPIVYQASATTQSGGTWLTVNPSTGSASASSPGQSVISTNAAGLSPGVYRGGVSYAFSSDAVRTVNITLLVEPPGASGAIRSSIHAASSSAVCAPSKLVATQTGLVDNFAQPAGWPTPLAINVLDDCGSPAPDAQVVATFTNGDPPLVLTPVDNSTGTFVGTWTPRSVSSQVTITGQASEHGLTSGSVLITGEVRANSPPILVPNTPTHVFNPLIGGSLAPGTIIQIYGSNLAARATPSTSPLTTNLGQTEVLIGGIPAPLYYVSPGQVNAQIPFELTPGNQYQLIVSANGALSTPAPLQLTAVEPGIAAYPATGEVIAQHSDYSLVTEASPAVPGETLMFYLAGLGATDTPVATGAPSPSSPLAHPTVPLTLTLNGSLVQTAFVGLTPTAVGLYQVNFKVPDGTPSGDLSLVVAQSGTQSNTTILPVHQ